MTHSFALAVLSLIGYLACIAWAIRQVYVQHRAETDAGKWHLSNHTFDKMPDVMEWALRHCLDRGYITVKARGLAYAIRFTKYIPRKGEYGIEFSFPLAESLTPFLPRLRTALTAKGIPIRETRGASILRVDCGQEAGKAVDLARLCFYELFDLPADTRFKTKPKRYSSNEEYVKDDDYFNHTSIAEHWKNIEARAQRNGQSIPPIPLSLKFFCCAFGSLFCHPILLVAWLQAGDAVPDWQVAAIGLQGHWNIVVLLLIYCGILAGLRRTARQLAKYRTPPPRPPWLRPLVRVMFFAPVLTVIASWLGF